MDFATILMYSALLFIFWGTLRALARSTENVASGIEAFSAVAPVIGKKNAMKIELELDKELDELRASMKPKSATKTAQA